MSQDPGAQALTLARAKVSWMKTHAPAEVPPAHRTNTARGALVPALHVFDHFRFQFKMTGLAVFRNEPDRASAAFSDGKTRGRGHTPGSFGFAQDLGSRLGRLLSASTLQNFCFLFRE